MYLLATKHAGTSGMQLVKTSKIMKGAKSLNDFMLICMNMSQRSQLQLMWTTSTRTWSNTSSDKWCWTCTGKYSTSLGFTQQS